MKVILTPSASTSLYDPKHPLWEDLNKINSKHILIHFKSPANDLAKCWLDRLEMELLTEEVLEHLKKAKQILNQFETNNIKLACLFDHDCLDSYFDFSLMCDYRHTSRDLSYCGYSNKTSQNSGLLKHITDSNLKSIQSLFEKSSAITMQDAIKTGLFSKFNINDLNNSTTNEPFTESHSYSKHIFNNLILQTNNVEALFSKNYYCSMRETENYPKYKSNPEIENKDLKIYLDINRRIPEVSVLECILKHTPKNLILIADNGKTLADNLSVLYSRMASSITGSELKNYLVKKINWQVMDNVNTTDASAYIQLLSSRWLRFHYMNSSIDLYPIYPEFGMFEANSNLSNDESPCAKIVNEMFCSPIHITKLPLNMPYCILFWGLFLEEMINYCKNSNLNLDQLTDIFRLNHWSTVGDFYKWKLFINERFIHYSDFVDHFNSISIDPTLWNLQSWYRAQYIVNNKNKGYKEISNDYAVITDFKSIALKILNNLVSFAGINHTNHINLLAKWCLGCSHENESPLMYFKNDWPRYLHLAQKDILKYEKFFQTL